MKKESGFFIYVQFKDVLDESTQDIIMNQFIDLVEKNNAFFGGGQYKDYIQGYLETDEIEISTNEFELLVYKYFLESGKELNKFIISKEEID